MAKKLQDFFQNLRDQLPNDLLTIERAVAPADYEVAALLQHLENEQRYPALLFEKPRNLKGEPSSFPLLSNLFATRRRCALALGMDPDNERLPLSLEYARREEKMIAPVAIPVREAPVKEVVKRGEDADLYDFPIVRHNAMGPAPYIDMTPVLKDPEEGFYNIAFLRNMVKGPRRLGIQGKHAGSIPDRQYHDHEDDPRCEPAGRETLRHPVRGAKRSPEENHTRGFYPAASPQQTTEALRTERGESWQRYFG